MITQLGKAHVTLSQWNIICVTLPNGDYGEVFIGYSHTDNLGRLSTKIQEYNSETGEGLTKSGSTYLTIGEPGIPHSDALYVLERTIGAGRVEKELLSGKGSGAIKFKFPVNM